MGDIQGHLGSGVFYDFEEMSCGDLLIALLKAMRPLPAGTLVEVRALDPGAPIDIPAWCRMVGHALLVRAGGPQNTHYLILSEPGSRSITHLNQVYASELSLLHNGYLL